MKLLIVFAVLLAAVCNIRAEITKEEAIAAATACKEEAGASDDDFEAMMKHAPADTTEGKCMRACALKKFGVLSDEGKMVKEAAIELAQTFIKDDEKKALAQEVIEACESVDVSADHCEAASEYGSCLRKEFEAKDVESVEL